MAMKPLYGIGQHVMVRCSDRPDLRSDNTKIVDYKAREVSDYPTREGPPLGHAWLYQVTAFGGQWFHESYIRPRPDAGMDWDLLCQLLDQPQPERCT